MNRVILEEAEPISYMVSITDMKRLKFVTDDWVFYTSTSLVNIVSMEKRKHHPLHSWKEITKKTLMPVFEFTDKYFGKYKSSN